MAYYKLITTVRNSQSIIPDAATLLPYCKSIQVRFGEKLRGLVTTTFLNTKIWEIFSTKQWCSCYFTMCQKKNK